MGNIHQHLAALTEIENQDKVVAGETLKVFGKKELFEGFERVLHMHDGERENEEAGAKEIREITTSVAERIKFEVKFGAKNLDMQLQREVANGKATADINLPDGTTITDIPVTFLMYLEKYLTRKRLSYGNAPTIDTTIKWEVDTDNELLNVRKTVAPESANKTEKQYVAVTIAKATDKHKEQAQLIDKDIIVGHYDKIRVTGLLTPLQKHNLLEYIDGCIVAVRIAKSKANNTQVGTETIGKKLFAGMNKAMLG